MKKCVKMCIYGKMRENVYLWKMRENVYLWKMRENVYLWKNV